MSWGFPSKTSGATTVCTWREGRSMKRRLRGSEMARAKSWAHHLVRRDDWVAIDVETTGLGRNAEVIEVAVIGAGGDTLLDTVVRPRTPPEPGAVYVHGLSADMLRRASPFENIHGTLAGLLEERTVIAYNAAFDRQAMDHTCCTAGRTPMHCTWECCMLRYEQWRGFNASLATACEIECIVATAPRHRALTDAQLVWRLIHRMAGRSA